MSAFDVALNKVSVSLGVAPELIISNRKYNRVVHARDIIVYILATTTSISWTDMGTLLGGRAPATIHCSFARIFKQIQQDAALKTIVEELMQNG